jgi:hypothetical protein
MSWLVVLGVKNHFQSGASPSAAGSVPVRGIEWARSAGKSSTDVTAPNAAERLIGAGSQPEVVSRRADPIDGSGTS